MTDFKFNLGSILKDKITGFQGVVTSRTEWLNACNVYGLQSMKLKEDGTVGERQHFDQPQLELIEDGVFAPTRETGGPASSIPMTNR